MNHFFGNIIPDSLTGAIFALEGIEDGFTILNGPTGCKFYHSAMVDGQGVRSLSFDPLEYQEEFYFGQPRVPCTYLDGYDYVYGSTEKLQRLLSKVKDRHYGFIAVINSPGAALIGDNLEGILNQGLRNSVSFAIESTGFSGDYGEGFQLAIRRLLENLKLRDETKDYSLVNILGIHLFQRHYLENIVVIKNWLRQMGLKLNVSMVENTTEELRSITKAGLNIVVCPEYGLETAKYLKEELGMEYIVPSKGAPIGFDASESFIKEVAEATGKNPSIPLIEIEKSRARAYVYLARYSSIYGLPKGALFSVQGESSLAYPLSRWLVEYLGMIPGAIEFVGIPNEDYREDMIEFLEGHGLSHVFQMPVLEPKVHMVFADGTTIAQMRAKDKIEFGVEVRMPSMGYLDVLPKSIYGGDGALYILEHILNGLSQIR